MIKKKCVICGKEFIAKYCNTQYCEECRIKSDKSRKAVENELRKKKKIVVHQPIEPEKDIHEIITELAEYNKKNKCNLSYGQYMLTKTYNVL